MIEDKNEVSKDLEKALQALEQAKQRVANEKKKQNEKKRKAENHHKYISTFAQAETLDLSSYSDTALVELLLNVQQEIADRRIEKSANLPAGSYIVGKDLPVGVYDISVIYNGSMWMDIYVYADGGDGDKKQEFTVFADGNYGDGTGAFHVDLAEGGLLKCSAPITLTISVGVMFE